MPRLIVCLLSFSMCMSSCFLKFYKTDSLATVPEEKINNLSDTDKIVIVHYNDSIFSLQQVKVNSDSIYGTIQSLDNMFRKYTSPSTEEPNKYKKKDEKIVLSQIHLYVDSPTPRVNDQVIISSDRIKRFDWYTRDEKAIKDNRSLSIFGLVLLAIPISIFLLAVVAFTIG